MYAFTSVTVCTVGYYVCMYVHVRTYRTVRRMYVYMYVCVTRGISRDACMCVCVCVCVCVCMYVLYDVCMNACMCASSMCTMMYKLEMGASSSQVTRWKCHCSVCLCAQR